MAAKRKTAAEQPKSDYEVGYGRPPKSGQFKKGESGNSRGRPKGSKNKPPIHDQLFLHLIREEAHRLITVTDKGKSVTMPMAQAVVRTVGMNALQGRPRAQKLFTDIVNLAERRDRERNEWELRHMIEYKAEKERQLRWCADNREEVPGLLPHPDDILINTSDSTIKMIGPRTPDEKENWEFLARMRELAREEVAYCERELETVGDDEEDRAYLEKLRETMREQNEAITASIGEWPNHWVKRIRKKRKASSESTKLDKPKKLGELKAA